MGPDMGEKGPPASHRASGLSLPNSVIFVFFLVIFHSLMLFLRLLGGDGGDLKATA